MFKKIYSLLALLLLIFTLLPQNISAQDLNTSTFLTNQEFFPTSENDKQIPLVPNGIPVTTTARTDGTGVDVYVGNIGVDGLDSVTVTVKATGYTTSKSKTSYVPAAIGKTFSFDFPMIKSRTTYTATIRVVDGSGTTTLSSKATLNFSESTLANAKWLKGTFATRGDSLDYHFKKHGHEVNTTNIVAYLNRATTYRTTVINDINAENTDKYKITVGSGSIASHKYKNKNNGLFIILSDSGYGIFSFGL